MTWTHDDLDALREGWDFEAKKAAGRDGKGQVPGDFWPTYSAMANTRGGKVVLGLKERKGGTFVVHGIADPDKVERDLWNELTNPQKASTNVLSRNDVFANPKVFIETLLVFPEGEELHEMHPVTGLMQLVVEITDPINYSPYWLDLDTFAPPREFFMTSGELDHATPHRTATAMALAARIPVIEPVAIPVPPFIYAGLPYASSPLSNNVSGKTAGFMQWAADGLDASHWVAFSRREAINAHMRFLESAAYEGGAVLERVENANVR